MMSEWEVFVATMGFAAIGVAIIFIVSMWKML